MRIIIYSNSRVILISLWINYTNKLKTRALFISRCTNCNCALRMIAFARKEQKKKGVFRKPYTHVCCRMTKRRIQLTKVRSGLLLDPHSSRIYTTIESNSQSEHRELEEKSRVWLKQTNGLVHHVYREQCIYSYIY